MSEVSRSNLTGGSVWLLDFRNHSRNPATSILLCTVFMKKFKRVWISNQEWLNCCFSKMLYIVIQRWSRFQWRIQDFPEAGSPTAKSAIIFHFFAENCMKMKEFGPPGEDTSLAPPLDPPMDSLHWMRVWPRLQTSVDVQILCFWENWKSDNLQQNKKFTNRKWYKFFSLDDFPFFRQMTRWVEDFRFWPRDRIKMDWVNVWYKTRSFLKIYNLYILCPLWPYEEPKSDENSEAT